MKYDFFVHRTVTRWRLVLLHAAPFPDRTCADQWRRTRTREAGDTNPDIREAVDRQGYSLFTIGASFDELDADLHG